MDKTSVIGIITGLVAIGVGMVFKGVNPNVLLNPAAILIIFVGTAASIIIAFPTYEISKFFTLLKIIFTEQKTKTEEEYISTFVDLATTARKEGLLSLEKKLDEIDDEFLKYGLRLAIDGQEENNIREIMLEEIGEMEERHQANATIFVQAGTYAPTLGVLGAVLGLIAALSHMDDIEALGHAIAAAFVATLMGIFSGYVMWHPFANKLKRKSKKEVKIKQLITVGVLAVQRGEPPMLVKQKLATYLPNKRKNVFLEGDK